MRVSLGDHWRIDLYLLKRSLHETGEPHQTEDNEETEKNVTLTVTASTALSLYLPLHVCLTHPY